MPINRRSLICILLFLSIFPALLSQTVGGQQIATVTSTVGYVTTTFVNVSVTTELSVRNTTVTIVQTNTSTRHITSTSLGGSTRITTTATLTSLNVKTVVVPTYFQFLQANTIWLLPLAVVVLVLAVLLAAWRGNIRIT